MESTYLALCYKIIILQFDAIDITISKVMHTFKSVSQLWLHNLLSESANQQNTTSTQPLLLSFLSDSSFCSLFLDIKVGIVFAIQQS